MSKIPKIAIAGADGKMGQMLIKQCLANEKVELVSALVVDDSLWLGKTIGEMNGCDCKIRYSNNIAEEIAKADVLIDFTRPQGTMNFLDPCEKAKTAMVIGTTGFSEEEKELITKVANKIPVLLSSNMATGVNVLFYLTKLAAALLADYDAEIFEIHHKHKVDAPSGTALTLGEQIIKGRDERSGRLEKRKLREVGVMSRSGHTGARIDETIGFSAARGGDVVGDHTVMFLGEGERIEIRHISTQRVHYANGAINAAIFLYEKPAKMYLMSEIIGIQQL